MDSGIVSGQVAAEALAKTQITLPEANPQDVGRFQDVLMGNDVKTNGLEPGGMQSEVLEFVDNGNGPKSGGLQDALIERASNIDSAFHGLMDDFANRPTIGDYVGTKADAADTSTRVYPAPIEGSDNLTDAQRYDQIIDRMETSKQGALEYQGDMSKWYMKFQIWSTGIQVASSAVSKISQGFQTLFRASG